MVVEEVRSRCSRRSSHLFLLAAWGSHTAPVRLLAAPSVKEKEEEEQVVVVVVLHRRWPGASVWSRRSFRRTQACSGCVARGGGRRMLCRLRTETLLTASASSTVVLVVLVERVLLLVVVVMMVVVVVAAAVVVLVVLVALLMLLMMMTVRSLPALMPIQQSAASSRLRRQTGQARKPRNASTRATLLLVLGPSHNKLGRQRPHWSSRAGSTAAEASVVVVVRLTVVA